jgi:hypothetical protein
MTVTLPLPGDRPVKSLKIRRSELYVALTVGPLIGNKGKDCERTVDIQNGTEIIGYSVKMPSFATARFAVGAGALFSQKAFIIPQEPVTSLALGLGGLGVTEVQIFCDKSICRYFTGTLEQSFSITKRGWEIV